MAVDAPNVALALGSVLPPQGDITELTVHLGSTNEVGSFDAILQNFNGQYSPTSANPIIVGSDGSISLGRGANCPLLMTCHIETVKYESTPTAHYVHVSGRCWGERLFRRVITKTYSNVKGEDIVKDLLDYYVGLNHVRNSIELVEATDTTYTSLSYQDTPVFEVLKYVAESADKNGVIGYDFRVAPDGKFEFFPKGTKTKPTNLTETIERSDYGKDVSRVRNRTTVFGAADKSVPTGKDEWTEGLTCSDGWWTATAGVISVDYADKTRGTASIKTYAENLPYGGCIFSLDTPSLVDAGAYPVFNVWLKREASFNGNVTLTLYDSEGRVATHEEAIGEDKWFLVQVGVGSSSADLWTMETGFDWTSIWRIHIVCWFSGSSTGSFWADGMYFGGKRYSATRQDTASQASYGLREQVEVNEELWSDEECVGRAEAVLSNLKSPAESLTVQSTVLDYGTSPILAGDTVHIVLPNEGIDADFRILSVEYRVVAATQELETTLQLGREEPLLADYVYLLRAKTDSLSRYKVGKR